MFASGLKKCKALSGFWATLQYQRKNIYFYIQICLEINQVTKLAHNCKISIAGLGWFPKKMFEVLNALD